MSEQVDSRKVANFRQLHFESLDDSIVEVQRILEADEQGHLQNHGNWSPGQTLAHIASWIEYGYDGFRYRLLPSSSAGS